MCVCAWGRVVYLLRQSLLSLLRILEYDLNFNMSLTDVLEGPWFRLCHLMPLLVKIKLFLIIYWLGSSRKTSIVDSLHMLIIVDDNPHTLWP